VLEEQLKQEAALERSRRRPQPFKPSSPRHPTPMLPGAPISGGRILPDYPNPGDASVLSRTRSVRYPESTLTPAARRRGSKLPLPSLRNPYTPHPNAKLEDPSMTMSFAIDM
jgi:hypothetical protein